jgi:hypothetical protein
MPQIHIGKILEKSPGVKREGDAFVLPEELDANAYVTIGQEVLQIPRLQRVELTGDLVTLTTHKNERFYFALEQMAGLRLGGDNKSAGRPSAGFFKST